MKLLKALLETPTEDPIDTITMDVPLFIRLLEYAREDAEDDMDLHDVAEKAIAGTKQQGTLSMDDYDMLINTQQELQEDAVEDTHNKKREAAKKALAKQKDPVYKKLIQQYLAIEDPIKANLFWNKYKLGKAI